MIIILQVLCPGCLTQVFLECTCPPGYIDAAGAHHPECTHADIDGQLACPPEATQCCQIGHDHAAAASACPADHAGAACPEPKNCGVWKGAIADARHPLYEGGHPLLAAEHQPGDDIPDCPGGHCHKDVPGCTVCRPVIITMLPGTSVTLAGSGG